MDDILGEAVSKHHREEQRIVIRGTPANTTNTTDTTSMTDTTGEIIHRNNQHRYGRRCFHQTERAAVGP
jgi:hypothetical protein